MSMDKMIGYNGVCVSNIADLNWVQQNTTILDNSAGVIPKTIRSIFVNAQVYPKAGHKAYFAMLLVTEQDSAVPNFAGNDAALNVALTANRDKIWTTQSGVVKYSADMPDDELIPFEPKTGRKLEPGQKLVFVLLARNFDNTTAGDLLGTFDYNIWFEY